MFEAIALAGDRHDARMMQQAIQQCEETWGQVLLCVMGYGLWAVLTQIVEAYGRDEAIFDACASCGYSLKEIGDHFGLHYSCVSRIVK